MARVDYDEQADRYDRDRGLGRRPSDTPPRELRRVVSRRGTVLVRGAVGGLELLDLLVIR